MEKLCNYHDFLRESGGELRGKKVLEIIFDSSCPKRVAAWLWSSKNHPQGILARGSPIPNGTAPF
jgi:hypothetical protein